MVGEPDGVVLALEDGLLDKLDGLKVFGFYLVHRKVIYRLQEILISFGISIDKTDNSPDVEVDDSQHNGSIDLVKSDMNETVFQLIFR